MAKTSRKKSTAKASRIRPTEKSGRNAKIKKAARAGTPYSKIAKQFRISKTRAWEIAKGG